MDDNKEKIEGVEEGIDNIEDTENAGGVEDIEEEEFVDSILEQKGEDLFKSEILYRHFAFTDFSRTESSLLFKPNPNIECYEVVEKDLFFRSNFIWIKDENNKNIKLKTHFRKKLRKYQNENATKIGVSFRTMEDGSIKKIKKSLDDSSKVCKLTIERNEYLAIPFEKFTTFTNDPNEPSFSYMDIVGIANKKGAFPQDWFWFEEQMDGFLVDVFRAYIYSLFVAKNTGRQLLVLLGEGETGKSMIINAISQMFQKADTNLVQAIDLSQSKNPHFSSGLLKARLLLLNDSNNPQIHTYNIVKNITGGDIIPVNIKNGPQFSTKLNSKILATTNVKLNINLNSKEEVSRLILINLEKSTNIDMLKQYYEFDESTGQLVTDLKGNYISKGNKLKKQQDFIDQLPWYLTLCKKAYEDLCEGDGDIKMSVDYINSLYSNSSEPFDDHDNVIEEYFIYDKGGFVSYKTLEIILMKYNEDNNTKEDIKTFKNKLSLSTKIKKNKGYDKNLSGLEKVQQRGFKGLRLKEGLYILVDTNEVKVKKEKAIRNEE